MIKFNKRVKKGISPLIAAVLLIAFTMTIAAILATWAQTFGEERLGEAGQRGAEAVDCPQLNLEVDSASWSSDRVEGAVVWSWTPGEDIDITSIRFLIRLEEGDPVFLDVDAPEDEMVSISTADFEVLDSETSDDIDSDNIEGLEMYVKSDRCPDVQPIYECDGFDGDDFIC